MPCQRVSLVERVRITRGPGREIVAARECRKTRSDKGSKRALQQLQRMNQAVSALASTPQPASCSGSVTGTINPGPTSAASGSTTAAAGTGPVQSAAGLAPFPASSSTSSPGSTGAGTSQSAGETAPKRGDRSRRAQENSLLDYFAGYVLAYELGGFLFVSLRTPPGTTPAQGNAALVRLRTGLVRLFPYVDGLVLQPDLLDESLEYLCGRGWHAHWSLERSDDGSPHYHVAMALFGYDVAEFESAVRWLWSSTAAGPHDIHFGYQLGADTVQYMAGPKETKGGRDAQDFSDFLGDDVSLGTKWWGAWGGRCLQLVKGHGEYVEGTSVEVLRNRAETIDRIRWNGRDVPAFLSHFVDAKTGQPMYVVSGPWLGAATVYMATGSLRALRDYRRARLRCRERRRLSAVQAFGRAFGF